MSRKGAIRRQAVVIIHGMGEQRPMNTLRSFVDGLSFWVKKFEPGAEKPRFWSRPDGVSDIFETRRITMEYFQGNPKTDFYEFYWAHHMRKTSYDHLFPWLKKLITTPLKKVPPRLKPVLVFVWTLISVALLLFLLIYFNWTPIVNYIKQHWIKTAGALAVLLFFQKLFVWVFKNSFSSLVLNTAGDAARYFNPMPSNIEERSVIRKEGIAFLKKLHERKEKPYDKIVVVGHSLGSVIAYDMVRLLWHEMHEKFEPSPNVDHKIFYELDKISCGSVAMPPINEFQQLQYQCFRQYRQNGNPWLISDLITIAGAITHADFYQLENIPFSTLIKQKEFPVCPPVMEGKDKTLFFDEKDFDVEIDGVLQKRTVKFLNHAAPFAITRWTNIYFTSDYIGSEGKRIFGKGVKDVEVERKSIGILPDGHTNYWDAIKDNKALPFIAAAIGFRQTK